MDPALRELVADGDPDEWIEAILRLEPKADGRVPHVRTLAVFADVRTVRVQRRHVEAVWAHPATASLKAARLLQFEDPLERTGAFSVRSRASQQFDPSPKPDLGRRGQGCVVGVVDWGFDIANDAFRKGSGASRVLALWDQRGPKTDESPRYGYGRVIRQAQIDAALATAAPYTALGYHPGDADTGIGAHGTHVADIAAGSIRGDLGGFASEADLVFVHLASQPLSGLANLGDSVRLLEAVQFIADQAGDRPVVINLSVGRHGGPHTGLTLVEQAFDRFLETAPNRLIVQSAGNYFLSDTHTHGRIAPGQTATLTWQVNRGDRSPNELEFWYSNRDRFDVTLMPPGARQGFKVGLGESRGLYRSDGAEIGRLYHRAFDPNTPDHHLEVFLNPAAPSGAWTLQVFGELVEDGRYHSWIERDGSGRRQSRFAPDVATTPTTVGSICNGFLPLSVGAAQTTPFGILPARFASAGPTRDGRQKPDLCAPGVGIRAARSTPRWSTRPKAGTARMSGASQAAPYVAGLAAALMSGLPGRHDIHALRRLITSAVRPIRTASDDARTQLGAGIADPIQARAALLTVQQQCL
ncbi:MAG: S8 family serine peptidase [Pseudomonadota bacterium]